MITRATTLALGFVLLTSPAWAQDHEAPKAEELRLKAASKAPQASAKNEALASKPIILGNAFQKNHARRYHVTSTTRQSAGKQRAEIKVLNDLVSERPVPQPMTSRMTFIEEETCYDVDTKGKADISYGLVAFGVEELVGKQKTVTLDIQGPDDIKKVLDTPKYMSVVALMEGKIRFKVDEKEQVSDLRMPRKLEPTLDKQMKEEYRKNLQSRYQAFFPDHPVTPGSKWTQKLSTGSVFWMAGAEVPEAELKCDIHFARVETLHGKRCAVLEVDTEMIMPKNTIIHRTAITKLFAKSFTGKSLIHFSIDDGTPMRERTTVNFEMIRRLGTADTAPIDTPLTTRQSVASEWVETIDFAKGEVIERSPLADSLTIGAKR